MKKAFTLVELLVVIIILSALFLAVTPLVDKTIISSKNNASNEQKELIYNQTNKYIVDNLLTDETNKCIKIDTLQKNGYLSNDVKDPVTRQSLTDYYVLVTYKNYQFSFELSQTCSNGTIY